MPPSAVVRFLVGWKLNTATSRSPATWPIGAPWWRAPAACAASSTTTRPRSAARRRTPARSTGAPQKCTGMMARVRGVMRRATSARSRFSERGWTSQNTVRPPFSSTMLGPLTQLMLGVMTSSPGCRSMAWKTTSSPAVAEHSATACGLPTAAANSRSNCATLGPLVIQPLRTTSATSRAAASPMQGRENGRRGSGAGVLMP